jgi:hypothetical protein
MPLFHLRLLKRNGETLKDDEEPHEYETLEAARTEAIEGLRELAATAIRDGRPFDYACVQITDESGKKLDMISARDAVPQLTV